MPKGIAARLGIALALLGGLAMSATVAATILLVGPAGREATVECAVRQPTGDAQPPRHQLDHCAEGAQRVGGADASPPPSPAGSRPLWVALAALTIFAAYCAAALMIAQLFQRRFLDRIAVFANALDRAVQSGFTEKIEVRAASDEFAPLADQVNKTLARASSHTDYLSRLAMHIAHDLRTPLKALDRNLRRLEARLDDPEASDTVQAARGNVESVRRRCEQLLAITRVETAAADTFAPIELSELVRTIVEDLFLDVSSGAMSTMIALDAPEPVDIAGLEEMIQRMVTNVLENASKFAVRGSTIRVCVLRAAVMARIAVENDGPRVPEDRLEEIFSPNVASSVTSGGGHGLGLPFVLSTARTHGGDAFAERTAGGMRFVMELPLRD